MSSAAIARVARARLFSLPSALRTTRTNLVQQRTTMPVVRAPQAGFATSARKMTDAHDPHGEESFEEFSARYDFLSLRYILVESGKDKVDVEMRSWEYRTS